MLLYLKCKTCIILLCFSLFITANLIFGQGDSLVWSDEFDGSSVDTDKWEFMIGDGTSYGLPSGWGNNELEYYREENATVDSGYLIITVKEENFGGKNYTSARMRTINKADFLYGKFEARMKLPTGNGMWPAFWMYPTEEIYGGWAASGEIDIMEAKNVPTEIRGTIHYGGEWPANVYSGNGYSDGDTDFSEDFHIYTLEWREGELKWYVDGNLFSTKTSWWSSGGDFPAPFNDWFHLLINVAVGGNFPGIPPDETTELPQKLMVDWIRVYQLEDETGIGESDNGKIIPDHFILEQNYPNPFNASTSISYYLPLPANLTLKVYNLLGDEIRVLINEHHTAGWHSSVLNLETLSSGVYFYRVQGDNHYTDTKKMILIR